MAAYRAPFAVKACLGICGLTALAVAVMTCGVVPVSHEDEQAGAEVPLVIHGRHDAVGQDSQGPPAPIGMRPRNEIPRWFVSTGGDEARARADNARGTELVWKTPANVRLLARAVEDKKTTRYLVRLSDDRERTVGWVSPDEVRFGPLKHGGEHRLAEFPWVRLGGHCSECQAQLASGRASIDALPERVPLFEQ